MSTVTLGLTKIPCNLYYINCANTTHGRNRQNRTDQRKTALSPVEFSYANNAAVVPSRRPVARICNSNWQQQRAATNMLMHAVESPVDPQFFYVTKLHVSYPHWPWHFKNFIFPMNNLNAFGLFPEVARKWYPLRQFSWPGAEQRN